MTREQAIAAYVNGDIDRRAFIEALHRAGQLGALPSTLTDDDTTERHTLAAPEAPLGPFWWRLVRWIRRRE